mgnify:CR=1 FL=1|jgi:hypothetical protein|tara:strand:+ start:448 stop:690 length:243 start_codon:yes stop_codon:yes gene_type:complete
MIILIEVLASLITLWSIYYFKKDENYRGALVGLVSQPFWFASIFYRGSYGILIVEVLACYWYAERTWKGVKNGERIYKSR